MIINLAFILLVNLPLNLSQNVQYQWNYLNFTWPSSESHNSAILDGSYIPQNTIISGIKVWKNRLYLSLPRWKNGVPATLVVTSTTDVNDNFAPLLEPYPNWEMQRINDCSAFQFVQCMEIDPLGRMWALDNGRTEFMTKKPKTKCPPRLLIIDLENNGQLLLEYVFPREVARVESVTLNDMVLDHEDGGWVYITDTDRTLPGIIVFSLKDKVSWKVTDRTMYPDESASQFMLNGTTFKLSVPIDGIALSPAMTEGNRILYYSPLSSYNLYSVPTRILKERKTSSVHKYITILARNKSSQTDGMIIDASGILFYGALTENTVFAWDTKQSSLNEHNKRKIFEDDVLNQWPDTFAIDENGKLWWTSNGVPRFLTDKIDLEMTNYRVIVISVGNKNYQYYGNGTSPKLPVIY